MSTFYHSLRWRLQLWHGLLLVLVLAGFATTAYQLQRANLLRSIDKDLESRLSIIDNTLRRTGGGDRLPPERLPNRSPGPRPGGPGAPGGMRPGDLPSRRPPGPPPPRGGDLPSRPPPGAQYPLPHDFKMSQRDVLYFEGTPTNGFYFTVWVRDGTVLAKSTSAPAYLPRPAISSDPITARARGSLREVFHYTPPGECLLVGSDISAQLAQLNHLAWVIIGAGSAVLLLGLAGGWCLSALAIRPIRDITGTATKIASGDLSQRIPVPDENNELSDLTAVLNATFARLESAFAQQARFTADASHELRTPVSVILSQTQMTLARDRTAPEYRETLEACQRAAQRMRRLIEALLTLARLDAGQVVIERKRFNLATALADCVELIQPLAAERSISFETDFNDVEIEGDQDRLCQVFINLLTNAIHYNKTGGSVRVTLRIDRDSKSALIEVADTGTGISEADLPYVFERFFRGDKSRAGNIGHAGLGLAISKGIIDAHAGIISASSQFGVGTIFTVKLPTGI